MRSIRSAILPLSLLTVLAAGCEDDVLNQVAGELVLEQVLDFGDVQVGVKKTLVLTLKNEGGATIRVEKFQTGQDIAGSLYQFEVPAGGLLVGAGTSHEVRVSFRPFEVMADPVEVVVQVLADGKTYDVTLRGRGIESGLIVMPNPVDFGGVLVDSSRTIDVTVSNNLSETVTIRTNVRGGLVDVEPRGGTGRFEVTAMPEPSGSLGELEPGASMILPVTYYPDVAGHDDRGRFVLSNCEFDLCEVNVDLLGSGSDSALQCTPAALDFEAVNPGVQRTLAFDCENTASDPITVLTIDRGAMSAIEFSVQPPAISEVGPGERFTVDVTFSPSQATFDAGAPVMGTVEVTSTSRRGDPLQPVIIQLVGRAGGPTVQVLPMQIDFGLVAVNTSHTKPVLVTNTGFEDLIVSSVDADADGTGHFNADLGSFTVAPGGAQIVNVSFEPTAEGQFTSRLVFDTNDTNDPTPTVTLTGSGVALPPCAYTISPPDVNFGNVPLSDTPVRGFSIENVGTDACLVNDIQFLRPYDPATSPFSFSAGVQTNVMLMPGQTHDVAIQYSPSRIATDTATVGLYISDPRNSNPTVPVFGIGEPLLQVTCPTPVTTAVGTPVTLTAMGLVAGANITGYQWTITNAPAGGVGTPNQWTPAPPTATTEAFLPFIVGRYDIRVDVSDDAGRQSSCTTYVTATGQGLVTTLTWNGTGDVDLHVHNQVTTSPWFQSPNDCYYGNRTPIWDNAFGAGLGPNPELDFDNTSANGPENTRISSPVINQPYTIAVHNYARSAGRVATLQIFCGGVTAPTQTFTSVPLGGASAGNCTTNDFWRVATVTFTSPSTCLITPINTYTASSQACTSF